MLALQCNAPTGRYAGLQGVLDCPIPAAMWDEPYLETCCRSALHRLLLVGLTGRPGGLKDGPCLARLSNLGFAHMRSDLRFVATEAGVARHAEEIAPTAQAKHARRRALS